MNCDRPSGPPLKATFKTCLDTLGTRSFPPASSVWWASSAWNLRESHDIHNGGVFQDGGLPFLESSDQSLAVKAEHCGYIIADCYLR